jgi:hypothetical protein
MNHHDEEIMILELFRKSYAVFPKGKLVKSESPDFILNLSPRKSIGIEITRLHDGSISKNNPGFPVAELTQRNIENTINHKEEKLPLYQKKKISECWLIIATDYIQLPKGKNIPALIEKWKFNTGYQKIFLIDLFNPKIHQLNIYGNNSSIFNGIYS